LHPEAPPPMGVRPVGPAAVAGPSGFGPGVRGLALGAVGAPVMRGAPPTAPRQVHPRFAPPPPIVERPVPRPGFVWAGGYYDWTDDHYVWVNGHYEPEQRDAYWSPPRWELQGGVFGWLPGGWISIQAGPAVAPPPPPPEPVVQPRPGFIWVPGNYEWRGDQYVWLAGRWEPGRPSEAWHPGRWERHGNHWVWRHGGWHRHH
jgi:hypothetical protein